MKIHIWASSLYREVLCSDASDYFVYTVCPTRYQTWHFVNNCNTNEDIASKFEQEYICCVRNEEECVCSLLQILLQYPR